MLITVGYVHPGSKTFVGQCNGIHSYGMILLHYVGDFNSVRIYMKSCIKMVY